MEDKRNYKNRKSSSIKLSKKNCHRSDILVPYSIEVALIYASKSPVIRRGLPLRQKFRNPFFFKIVMEECIMHLRESFEKSRNSPVEQTKFTLSKKNFSKYIESVINERISEKRINKKPSFISENEFNKDILLKNVLSISMSYIEDTSYSSHWNKMLNYVSHLLISTNKSAMKKYYSAKYTTVKKNRSKYDKSIIKTRSYRGYKDDKNQKDDNYIMFPIMYGTSRKPLYNNDNETIGYENNRGRGVCYGECLAKIKKTNILGGDLNESFLKKLKKTVTCKDISERKIFVEGISRLKVSEFCEAVNKIYQDANEYEMILYIHGYNTSFEDAAIRAAQIGYDLKFKGVTSFFSWASKDNILGYSADVETSNVSHKYLYEFINNIWKKTSINKIHIISHSMGNRVFLNTLKKLKEEKSSIKFGHILLAAPDLDTEEFDDNSNLYVSFSDKTTLYVSPDDKAVKASLFINKEYRVGLSPPVKIVEGIDTIEVDQLISKPLLELGHGYYAESEALLYDIHGLIVSSLEPDKRLKLKRVEIEKSLHYWNLII